MRLSGKLKQQLIQTLNSVFLDHSEFILFGSRVDLSKYGGDIDIAIKSKVTQCAFKKQRILFFTKLARADLDLKIDLVQYFDKMDPTLKEEIDREGISLR